MRIKKKKISNFIIPMRENVLIFCMQPWTVLGIIFEKIQIVQPQEWPKLTGKKLLNFCFNPFGMLPGTPVVPCGEHPLRRSKIKKN